MRKHLILCVSSVCCVVLGISIFFCLKAGSRLTHITHITHNFASSNREGCDYIISEDIALFLIYHNGNPMIKPSVTVETIIWKDGRILAKKELYQHNVSKNTISSNHEFCFSTIDVADVGQLLSTIHNLF